MIPQSRPKNESKGGEKREKRKKKIGNGNEKIRKAREK